MLHDHQDSNWQEPKPTTVMLRDERRDISILNCFSCPTWTQQFQACTLISRSKTYDSHRQSTIITKIWSQVLISLKFNSPLKLLQNMIDQVVHISNWTLWTIQAYNSYKRSRRLSPINMSSSITTIISCCKLFYSPYISSVQLWSKSRKTCKSLWHLSVIPLRIDLSFADHLECKLSCAICKSNYHEKT